MTNIVSVNVGQQIAPAPSTLQKRGAFISMGGTNLTPRSSALLTRLSDLDDVIATPKTISAMTFSGGTVTVTTAAPHGWPVSAQFRVDIAGVTPGGYNGNYAITVTSTTQFTYALVSNPGSVTVQGTAAARSIAELERMVSTFFAQGFQQSVYVLELGAGSVAQGVAALTSYLAEFPNTDYSPGSDGYFYSYVVPRDWDGATSFLALLSQYQSPTARTNFFITTTLQNYPLYTDLQKAAFALIEAPTLPSLPNGLTITGGSWAGGVATLTTTGNPITPGQWFRVQGCVPAGYNGWARALAGTNATTLVYALATNPGDDVTTNGTVAPIFFPSTGIASNEFSVAHPFWVTLNYSPSETNKVPPLAHTYAYGVTPFPKKGLSATIAEILADNVNFIDTGAEGGISNAMIANGKMKDGNPFNYWYATDWVAVNSDLAIANAVINGSNSSINPLYYNQRGIDRLQGVLAQVLSQAVSFGLVLFPPKQTSLTGAELTAALDNGDFDGFSVVNAVPFIPYSQSAPGHYAEGRYDGFSVTFTPLRGFERITISLTVSSFVVQ